MKNYKVNTAYLNLPDFPEVLAHIPDPPKQIFWQGTAPTEWLSLPRVAIVGSRKVSAYGHSVTTKLAGEMARAGIVVISGLALGIDAQAHAAALDAGGLTVAVLPTPLDKVHPSAHRGLAQRILDSGGSLISEYPLGSQIHLANFTRRNRLVSGLADVILITEAAARSGTMNTASYALEQGRTVMCVPGNITSPGSEGTNNLIKSGALPVTDASDVFFALKLNPKTKRPLSHYGTAEEKAVLRLLAEGIHAQEDLALAAQMDGARLAATLTTLELTGRVRPAGGGNWTLT